VELSAFAEQVLVGRTLADKLLAPDVLLDTKPAGAGSGVLPSQPGREAGLALATGRLPATPLQVPDDALGRGALLHAFANHELLAIELLAQALLRFSDAPAAFRRGLLQTLQEEQRHLSLYLARMRELGTALGSQPLSGFFWKAMSGLPTPQAFVAHLSLTFEQANLDFALHYQRQFAALGDHGSADVLQTVLDDEVGHVAFGLRWFERWRDPNVPLFEAHRDALQPPLQVVRAKAATFEVEPRRRAGLPEAYIDRLRTCGGSRGRPAKVWWFNGAVEQEVEHGLCYTAPASTRVTLQDLETVPLVLSQTADVVLVRSMPRPAFLDGLARAGFSLPRFEVADFRRSPWPAPRGVGAISDLCPWGASPRADAFARTAAERASGELRAWHDDMRALYDKRTAVRMACSLPDDRCWTDARRGARVAESWAEVLDAARDFEALGHATRIKPVFGAAGRGHRVLRGHAEDETFVSGLLRRSGAVIVEPQFDVVAQLSIRLHIDTDGAHVQGVGRCESCARGQFDHAVIGPPDLELPGDVRRWLRGDGRDVQRLRRLASAVADVVGPEASRAGFRGPAGVDALLVRTEQGLLLRPLVDLNPRHTMGHVADALRGHVSSRAYAVARMTTRGDLRSLGFDGFESWADAVEPPAFEDRDGRRRITGGVLHLTDPVRAEAVVLSLSVARTLEAARDALRRPR